ncbi:uncharacterized protein VP01_522g6 [Puccinia sorghi]|uniref:DUF4219 domain-containing protein n=1 Tax=Puccinia sorghi TaxID=27349 RepID=A0A0L6UKL5_9BASI|nr:uncharacterized protein VP01_522g6 [Puccinia sorghi]
MSDGKNLPVLTSSNFTSWKIKAQGYCMQHSLYKFLTNSIPLAVAANPNKKEDWDEKRIRVTGILYQFIGETNHQRFITKDNTEDPYKIWTALEFLALTYKSSILTFLDKLDTSLSSLAAAGLVVGNPQNADIKESLLAEAILAKLPGKFSSVTEILYQKRPLTIATIRECLYGKH